MFDIRGVARLTLEVDYGEGLDLSDHADWANARLLRGPTAEAPTGRSIQ
jgi:hypothetical protein